MAASKTSFSAACLLVLLVAITFLSGQVAACGSCGGGKHHHTPPTPSPPAPGTPVTPAPGTPVTPAPGTPVTPAPGTPVTPSPGTPVTPSPGTPCPAPPPSSGSCPTDVLKLGACANVLGLVKVGVGHPPSGGGDSCCPLLSGLADLEAAVCLCTALKANVLGIVLNIPIKLTFLLNYCGKSTPEGFMCA